MTSATQASAHVRKAREFLDAAEVNLAAGRNNAAASDAVTAGINAKDAMCLRATGATHKSDRHADAVAELARVGREGAQLASTLARLLRVKSRSQYGAASVTKTQAANAVGWARRLVEAAGRK